MTQDELLIKHALKTQKSKAGLWHTLNVDPELNLGMSKTMVMWIFDLN